MIFMRALIPLNLTRISSNNSEARLCPRGDVQLSYISFTGSTLVTANYQQKKSANKSDFTTRVKSSNQLVI